MALPTLLEHSKYFLLQASFTYLHTFIKAFFFYACFLPNIHTPVNTSETTWGLVAQQYFGMQTGAAKNKTTCSTF